VTNLRIIRKRTLNTELKAPFGLEIYLHPRSVRVVAFHHGEPYPGLSRGTHFGKGLDDCAARYYELLCECAPRVLLALCGATAEQIGEIVK